VKAMESVNGSETPLDDVAVRGSTRRMVMLEIAIYVLIAVSSLASCFVDRRFGLGISTATALILVIAIMGMWPLYSNVVDAVVGAIGGVFMIFATQLMVMDALSDVDQFDTADRTFRAAAVDVHPTTLNSLYTIWAFVLLLVLVIFVVEGFLHQMLRRSRAHMVRSMSHSLMLDVVLVASSGWVLSPLLFRYVGANVWGEHGPLVVAIVSGVAVVLFAGLSWASTRWWKDYVASMSALSSMSVRRDRSHQSCAAIGFASVMCGGFVIFLALVALLLFVG
jgi:hypothetical protein